MFSPLKEATRALSSEHNEILCLFQLQCQNDNLQDDLDVYKDACEEHKAEVQRVTENKMRVDQELQSASNEVRSLVLLHKFTLVFLLQGVCG